MPIQPKHVVVRCRLSLTRDFPAEKVAFWKLQSFRLYVLYSLGSFEQSYNLHNSLHMILWFWHVQLEPWISKSDWCGSCTMLELYLVQNRYDFYLSQSKTLQFVWSKPQYHRFTLFTHLNRLVRLTPMAALLYRVPWSSWELMRLTRYRTWWLYNLRHTTTL